MKPHQRTITWVALAVLCGAWNIAAAQGATQPAAGTPDHDRWTSYVGLGAQFLPDYDENGRGSGLNKQELFALVTADGKFGDECTSRSISKGFNLCAPMTGPWHSGFALTLLGTAVKRQDKPSISPTEFNDVANTAVMSGYVYAPMLQSKDLVDNFGPFARASAISRENLDTNGDSVTWTYGLGFQYTSEHYRTDDNAVNDTNAAPRGFARAYAARYEDYAGFGKSTRFIVDAAFRVYPEMDLYFGFQGNFGDGPDEMAVVLSFVRRPDQIASLFTLGK